MFKIEQVRPKNQPAKIYAWDEIEREAGVYRSTLTKEDRRQHQFLSDGGGCVIQLVYGKFIAIPSGCWRRHNFEKVDEKVVLTYE